MADTEQQEEFASVSNAIEAISFAEVGAYGFWHNDTKDVPEHYVNAFIVIGDSSDVTMLLGNTYRDRGSRVDLCKLRVTMTHRNFLQFAEDVRKQATFLKKIYKETGPGPNYTQEEMDAALEEVFGQD